MVVQQLSPVPSNDDDDAGGRTSVFSGVARFLHPSAAAPCMLCENALEFPTLDDEETWERIGIYMHAACSPHPATSRLLVIAKVYPSYIQGSQK
jgi:hypothetical protein